MARVVKSQCAQFLPACARVMLPPAADLPLANLACVWSGLQLVFEMEGSHAQLAISSLSATRSGLENLPSVVMKAGGSSAVGGCGAEAKITHRGGVWYSKQLLWVYLTPLSRRGSLLCQALEVANLTHELLLEE